MILLNLVQPGRQRWGAPSRRSSWQGILRWLNSGHKLSVMTMGVRV